MIQSNSTILGNYKDNCAIFNKMKPKKVDMVIIGHCHCDHIGLIPMLFSRGNEDVKIIAPKNMDIPIIVTSKFYNEIEKELINLGNREFVFYYPWHEYVIED